MQGAIQSLLSLKHDLISTNIAAQGAYYSIMLDKVSGMLGSLILCRTMDQVTQLKGIELYTLCCCGLQCTVCMILKLKQITTESSSSKICTLSSLSQF